MSLLGVDIGTTGVRAGVYGDSGTCLALRSRRTKISRQPPGRATVDVDSIRQAVEEVVTACCADLPTRDRVEAVSFSSLGEAAAAVDRAGRPLAPVILGMDVRGAELARHVGAAVGSDLVQTLTGQPLHPMFTLYKIGDADCAGTAGEVAAYRTVADHIAQSWGAAPAIDWTSAARTGMFDVQARAWSEPVLAAASRHAPWLLGDAGLPRLSEPVAPGTAIGRMTATAACRLRVPTGTPIVAGAHDQAASYLGAGGRPGLTSSYSLGSTDCLCVGSGSRPAAAVGTGFATYPIADDHWLTLAGTAAGGLSLEWYADLLGRRGDDVGGLLGDLAFDPPQLLVLPYLAGASTLDNDPSARGVIAGLTLDTTPQQLTRAFIEATGYELARMLDALARIGLSAGSIRATGSGAENRRALCIRAAASGSELTALRGAASTRGAALLAGKGIGLWDLSALPQPDVEPEVTVDRSTRDWYDRQRVAYRQLYDATRSVSAHLGTTDVHAAPAGHVDPRRMS